MSKKKSLFKSNKLLHKNIDKFLNSYRSVFAQEVNKTSAYFELSIYNNIVKFYETNGYLLEVKNLKNKKKEFIYALSPNAKPSNCSYFIAKKEYSKRNGEKETFSFEIRHNLRIQSHHENNIFISPDYAVIFKNSIKSTKLNYYFNGKVDYFYVKAEDVVTFAETKNYIPSPELVFNFIGLVNEIKPCVLNNTYKKIKPKHLAPSLFISGNSNNHLTRIKYSLEKRYKINIFMGMFAYPSQLYSKRNQHSIKKIGTI